MTAPITPIDSGSTEAAAQGQVARKYQEEIFQQAQKGNIIAYLRTGSGKTLISVMLIRWMSTQENARGKTIVFFVPKVSLVEQQARYIEKETGLRVDRLHGALAHSFSDRPAWRKKFENHDVIVVTAQLFIELVTHSLCSINRVSLMVFDECHHARKNHPYNGVMREYAQIKDARQKPKIFGMTASPYWNEKNPTMSLKTLEANLHAKIVGVHEHVEELQASFSSLDEVIQQYPYPPEKYDGYPEPSLYDTLKVFHVNYPDLFGRLNLPWAKIEMRYYMTMNNLGPYCGSLYLFSEVKHHLSTSFTKTKEIFASEDDMKHNLEDNLPLEMFDILDILEDFSSFFESAPDSPNTLPILVPLTWNSPKVRVLVELIQINQKLNFQCIIFVEQRQVASCLAKVLEAIPEVRGLARCAHLVGQGMNNEGVSNQAHAYKGDPIKLFREKEINILIATSVAEEGLDFPACDLVIRFDPLQHLVGYVQSRGRARSQASKYVVMIQQDNVAQLERYRALQQGEHQLNQTYQHRGYAQDYAQRHEYYDDPWDVADPWELAERDRIVIPSTGAILTYDNAMSLINHLCALIPRDAFTPPHKPIYSGEFQARLRLPASLPLPSKDLVYIGYPKRSKREARRSVAFLAVKHLLRLNVFNEYLLPVSHEGVEESDDDPAPRNVVDGKLPPEIMDVRVKDPWYLGEKLWLHELLVVGQATAGMVTGTSLPPAVVLFRGREVQLCAGAPLPLDLGGVTCARQIMNEFTKWGIRARNTGRPFDKCTFFLVPLREGGDIDFDKMIHHLQTPPSTDWSAITEDFYDGIFVLNRWESGRTYRLKAIRADLSLKSAPLEGSPASKFTTYYDYYKDKWTTKRREAIIPLEGPLLEVVPMTKQFDGAYSLKTPVPVGPGEEGEESKRCLVPRSTCSWVPFSLDLSDAFASLPVLCRRVTDIYRVRNAQQDLRLPYVPDNLLIEALTLPMALRGFNNQRLETLGDAVLNLSTTIHLLNQYPNRHEGQLSKLRQKYIANRYLLNRAREFGLESYLSSEATPISLWRYANSAVEIVEESGPPQRFTSVTYPRRSLQDCVEALMGASYLCGGIDTALRTGTALGLNFGGSIPWPLRYHSWRPEVPVAPLFTMLQEKMGYEFKWNHILVEAVTHPSFASSDGTSYQRLEFLGDSLIGLVAVDYLFKKFPTASSHELSYLRAKVVCAPTLAFLAVTKLRLNQVVLANSMNLWRAIDQYVPILEALSPEEIVKRNWRYDPPKAISDVFESVMGAVLVDSGYNYEKAATVAEMVMEDVLGELSLDMATNPVSELLEWLAKHGCTKREIRKVSEPDPDTGIYAEGVVVEVHSKLVAGPVTASSSGVAKFIAAERALTVLSDASNPFSLVNICDCHNQVIQEDSKEEKVGESAETEGVQTGDGDKVVPTG